MKRLIIALAIAMVGAFSAKSEHLVLLHTNDTHSAIDPLGETGGILQRQAIIDSVRNAEKNVLLIDAGDMVQGSLYFKKWRGDVEYPLFNMADYDIRILGNHEFDNGMKELAGHYKQTTAIPLSANYDFTGTELEGVFQPYTVKKVDGKKIGFIGINLYPNTIISDDNIQVNFLPIIETANKYASLLKKKEKVDLVVAVTHIGYEGTSPDDVTDVDLAKASKDIDIIIGGHSHTMVPPGNDPVFPSIIMNAAGEPVLVTQTGKYGRNVGYINVDLEKVGKKGYDATDYVYELIPVTNRFPEESLDVKMKEFLAPYSQKVDSINSHVIGKSLYSMKNYSPGLSNITADFAKWYGDIVADSIGGFSGKRNVDLGFMNLGGIRKDMPEGDVTEGQILDTYPFSNHFVVMEISGKDLLEALKVAATKKSHESVSDEVRVVVDGPEMVAAYIGGNAIEPDKDYLIGTIDYVANGKDLLVTMANGKVLWRDKNEVVAPLMRYFKGFAEKGLPIAPDQTSRFQQQVKLATP